MSSGLVPSDNQFTNLNVRKHLVAGQLETSYLDINGVPLKTYVESFNPSNLLGTQNVLAQNFTVVTGQANNDVLYLQPQGYNITDQSVTPAANSYINGQYIDNSNSEYWVARVAGTYLVTFTSSTNLIDTHDTQSYTANLVKNNTSQSFVSTGNILSTDITGSMIGSIIIRLEETDSFFLYFLNSLNNQNIIFTFSSLNVTYLSQ